MDGLEKVARFLKGFQLKVVEGIRGSLDCNCRIEIFFYFIIIVFFLILVYINNREMK
jgi:hypothetical protein